jgi:hypothetical protein|tara:strand:- start:2296 stop:2499 length:204 start_codon:yes stop_codon:yes gene_type:complete
MIPVKDHKNLYRDEESGAIISTDSIGYAQYMKTRSKKRTERDEIEEIKSDIAEIKGLLKEIVRDKGC